MFTKNHEYWPLGSISTKMGRIAADNICGKKSIFKGFVYTTMFKVFDLKVARTGLTTEAAKKEGFDIESVIVSGLDKAHYYKDSEYVILKIIADKKTRKIIGAQGYSKGEVVSRIEILACAISESLTLDDVFNWDLGYAPSFNNPIDVLQTGCIVLSNKLDGLYKSASLDMLNATDFTIVDVSPPSEHLVASIPKSVNIPLENMRKENLPFGKDANIVLFSKNSSGAYEAFRYLSSKGYSNIYVLEGGYIFWKY